MTEFTNLLLESSDGIRTITINRESKLNALNVGTITELKQGSSVGVRVTPPTGNTSMEVEVIIEIFKRDI